MNRCIRRTGSNKPIEAISKRWAAAALLGLCVGAAERVAGQPYGEPPPPPSGEGEVLTRGPVHEAFAEAVIFDPEPDVVITATPPEPIEELPPDQRPEGFNVVWVPGYWGWDDERNDFIWISGVWRDLPPGRQWVSGYWARSAEGYFWTPGYWAGDDVQEVDYLPDPPESVEIGPNIDPPSPDFVWVPGCWMWLEGRYAWRPGYWIQGQPDWVWVPAHYAWAPPGNVFVEGYWDYPVVRRGVLFAPVYFEKTVYVQREVHYSPSIVIDLDIFSDHLFLRPSYHHYYFGDYYAPHYEETGFHFAFSVRRYNRYAYDPICAHRRWVHRNDRDWDVRVEADFRHRREREDARPPRTYASQRKIAEREGDSRERSRAVAGRYDEIAKRKGEGARQYQRVEPEERRQIADRGREVRKSRIERQEVEAREVERSPDRTARDRAPARVKVPRSPIRGKPSEGMRDRAPPKRPQAPEVDRKVEPKPRQSGSHKTKRAQRKP